MRRILENKLIVTQQEELTLTLGVKILNNLAIRIGEMLSNQVVTTLQAVAFPHADATLQMREKLSRLM